METLIVGSAAALIALGGAAGLRAVVGGPAEPGPVAVAAIGAQGDEPIVGGDLPPPHLPGAATEPPDWVGDDAPFDVASYFDGPPPGENAAPLYLDAFLEFDPEVAICFPEGPERERRAEVARERLRRYGALYTALSEDEQRVTSEQIDRVITLYDDGFRKLDAAQRRPSCVFRTGLGVTARIPHAHAARQVARIIELRVRRAVELGDTDAALRDIGRALRLSRDLQPRGPIISQLVATGLDGMVVSGMIPEVLTAPGLTAPQCDRLTRLLEDHRSGAIDAYAEGLKGEYLMAGSTLVDLVRHQGRLAEELRALSTDVGPSVVAAVAEPVLMSVLAGDEPAEPEEAGPRGLAARVSGAIDALASTLNELAGRLTPRLREIPDLDARVAATPPEVLDGRLDRLGTYYGALLELDDKPVVDRLGALPDAREALGSTELIDRVALGLVPAVESFTVAVGRLETFRRAAPCVVALRRWQVAHAGRSSPPDLAAALAEVGIGAVPIDPFDGEPLRMAVLDGEPIVYSVGPDGDDDGAREDVLRTWPSGDLLLRATPPPEGNR